MYNEVFPHSFACASKQPRFWKKEDFLKLTTFFISITRNIYKGLLIYSESSVEINTAWKVSVFGVILVRIFPHLLRISPYSVRMWENTDQNNSKYGHFLRSERLQKRDCAIFSKLQMLTLTETILERNYKVLQSSWKTTALVQF